MRDRLYRKILKPHTAVKTVVAGFGLSGRVFHSPIIQHTSLLALHGIMTSGDEAAKIYPKARIYRSFEEVIQDQEVELVFVCTPHHLHFQHAAAALMAGKHVVVEKPVTPGSEELRQLIQISEAHNRLLIPYHNRRWDGDFLTVAEVIKSGYLGEVVDFESRFDRYSPVVNRAEWRYATPDGGGTLLDLGPHLIDQALLLFGPPDSVYASLQILRDGSKCNDAFDLKFYYPRLIVSLRAGIFVKKAGYRFQVHGTQGSFLKRGIDPQEADLKLGKVNWQQFGADRPKYYGELCSCLYDEGRPSEFRTIEGQYRSFYQQIASAILNQKPSPVSVHDALMVAELIELAQESHRLQKNLNYSPKKL